MLTIAVITSYLAFNFIFLYLQDLNQEGTGDMSVQIFGVGDECTVRPRMLLPKLILYLVTWGNSLIILLVRSGPLYS